MLKSLLKILLLIFKFLLKVARIFALELGINSVYTSKRGNIIWGTRTMYSKQSSYFGKTNVMRVCSAILKNIYPIAVETLHTDAASNPITRASLSTMLNSVLDTFIAGECGVRTLRADIHG